MLTTTLIGAIALGVQVLLIGAILTLGTIKLIKLVKTNFLHH